MAEALLRQIQNLDDLDHEDAAAPRQWNRSQHLKFARKCVLVCQQGLCPSLFVKLIRCYCDCDALLEY